MGDIPNLSKGTIPALFGHPEGRVPEANEDLIYQVLHLKAVQDGARYRVIVSDSQTFVQSMLAGPLRTVVADGVLRKGMFIKVTEYNGQVVNGSKRILVLTGLEVLTQYGEHDKVGAPVSLDNFNFDGVDQPQPAAEPQQPQGITGNNFYGGQRQNNPAPTRNQPNQAEISRYGQITPIEGVSPYSHKWTIRARVTHKSPIKSWHNQNGEGQLFSVNLLDESGEIRATLFSTSNDKFHDYANLLQEGNVYYISSPCQVKLAKRNFSQVNNDYELTFERDTKVEKAQDQGAVPQIRYNFTNIGQLNDIAKDTTIDTIGVLKEYGEVNEIVSKSTGKPFSKRELTLVDETRHQVRLTIWGESALSFDVPLESVVAFKGVKVSDFGGRSLSLLSSGTMNANPDIDEAHKLKGWYDAAGREENFTSHQNSAAAGMGTGRQDQIKTIAQVKDEALGQSGEADYFTVKASVLYVKDGNISYPSCRTPDCKRKMIEAEVAKWNCEKCGKVYDRPLYRYILQLNVADHTGQMWLSAFDESGALIMGKSADDLADMKEEGDEQGFKQTLEEATCKTYSFRCRAKLDTYNDESRVRYQIMYTNPVNYQSECARLVEQIKAYSIKDENSDSLFVN